MDFSIESSWGEIISAEFEKPYFHDIVSFLKNEKKRGAKIYPNSENIFKAFELTPFEDVRVLLLGQDPYHGVGQAHGLCFSVQNGISHPPSLKNIFKEMHQDLQIPIPISGDLSHWARQGILMLNASLTVEDAKPMSHSKIGWEIFTDAVIRTVSEKKEKIIFVLWGKFAQQKESLIDTQKHILLKAAHPSPLSAHNGFWGCKHFSKINALLIDKIQF